MAYNDQPFRPGGFQVIPPAIKMIIVANVAIFLLQNLPIGGMLTTIGALWPVGSDQAAGYGFKIWQPVTYMFLHGSMTHLFFNMFALWMFGAEIENYWGTHHFTTYYFTCGIGAALINIFATIGDPYPTVGASGAIYGVLLAFGMMFPDRYIFLYFLFPVKTKYFVAGYALIEFISGLGSRSMGSGSNVAHFAHLGGMLIGFLYIMIKRNEWSVSGWIKRFRPASRKPTGPTLYRGRNGCVHEPPTTEKEIDEILDKISLKGYSALTAEEKRKLLQAGRK